MMGRVNGEFLSNSVLAKLSVFALLSVVLLILSMYWSDENQWQMVFFNSSSLSRPSARVSSPPAMNLTLDVGKPIESPAFFPSPSPSPYSSSCPGMVGLLDENGTMTNDFFVGEFGPDEAENSAKEVAEKEGGRGGESGWARRNIGRFPLCPESLTNNVPCMDNTNTVRRFNSMAKEERFERHCPNGDGVPKCLVPVPANYRRPIPWPKSRDEVWRSNVADIPSVKDKEGTDSIRRKKRTIIFPDTGRRFIGGVNKYLDQIAEMVPDIAFGLRTRVVLDIGCGIASFGAFLMSRKVITLSIAPKDKRMDKIQLALERGVPAMLAAFGTHRVSYPSQAFEFIHCSGCQIDWTRDDGALLLEVNRMLRAGSYFAWGIQSVKGHENIQEAWRGMERVAASLCWKLVKKNSFVAIWQKPTNNSCYLIRGTGTQPQLCDHDDDPDNLWYVHLKRCITRLPENGFGGKTASWPERLHAPPDRLQTVSMDSYTAQKELFKADSKYWNDVLAGYFRVFRWKKLNLRNVLDMRAKFGGFATALIDNQIDCWVMNVVPISDFNTLPVIYDRGLIGVIHDWCEPFATYPRTYDLLHAAGLFSREHKRCDISSIMLEMDRILRPGGYAFIEDMKPILEEVHQIASAMGWRVSEINSQEGPYSNRKVLRCEKPMLQQ